MIARFVLPYPPSANRYWQLRRTTAGRTILVQSPEGKVFKRVVASLLRPHVGVLLRGDVRVTAHLFRPQASGDLGNRIKVTEDALNGLIWTDDNQVAELHWFRWEDPAHPRVELVVEEITDRAPPPEPIPMGTAYARAYALGLQSIEAVNESRRQRARLKEQRANGPAGPPLKPWQMPPPKPAKRRNELAARATPATYRPRGKR